MVENNITPFKYFFPAQSIIPVWYFGTPFDFSFIVHKLISINLDYEGIHYNGWATFLTDKNNNGTPESFQVVLNGAFFGNLHCDDSRWQVDIPHPQGLVNAIGDYIWHYYE